MMAPVAAMAEQVRKDRRPVAADNPFVAMQENVSRQIVAALDAWRDMSEALAERTFLAVYGSPALQAAVGIDPAATRPLRKAREEPAASRAAAEPDRRAQVAHSGRRAARSRDPRAALCRHGAGRRSTSAGSRLVRRIRRAHGDMPLVGVQGAGARAVQHAADRPEAALAAIPAMLPPDAETRRKAFDLIRQVLARAANCRPKTRARLQRGRPAVRRRSATGRAARLSRPLGTASCSAKASMTEASLARSRSPTATSDHVRQGSRSRHDAAVRPARRSVARRSTSG